MRSFKSSENIHKKEELFEEMVSLIAILRLYWM